MPAEQGRMPTPRKFETHLVRLGQAGEEPNFALAFGSPGGEEAALAAVQAVLGSDIPILGGSTTDNSLEGQWQQIGCCPGPAKHPTGLLLEACCRVGVGEMCIYVVTDSAWLPER